MTTMTASILTPGPFHDVQIMPNLGQSWTQIVTCNIYEAIDPITTPHELLYMESLSSMD